MSTRTHLISDAAYGPITQSEIHYAQQLVGSAPEHSLTLFDRGFFRLNYSRAGKMLAKIIIGLRPFNNNAYFAIS